MMGTAMVWWLFFLFLAVSFAVWLVRQLFPQKDSGSADALEIARLRLARGEIDQGEFERIKRNLEGG